MPNLRVLLVAADPLARAGMASLLAEAETLDLVGQIDLPADWDQALAVFRPAVVLWDLGWEGIAPERDLLTDPGVPLILLFPGHLPASELLGTGAAGFLPRAAAAGTITAALQAAAAELVVFDREMAATLAVELQSDPPTPGKGSLDEPLTPREEEVLNLLADGLTNKAIGRQLDISPHTVKFHITGILRKLDAQSRTEAVTAATRLGLLTI